MSGAVNNPHERSLVSRLAELEKECSLLRSRLAGIVRNSDGFCRVSCGIPLFTTDPEGTIRFWNAGAEALYGYTAADVVDRATLDLLHPNSKAAKAAADDAVGTVLRRGGSAACELAEVSADGRGFWVKLHCSPRLDAEGHVIGILHTAQEITEYKNGEKKHQHNLRKLRRAVGGTIHAMALAVEKRDPYTAGHQRRTTDLARATAMEMGLSRERIEGVRMAGVIHDLGKIYVPAEILNKPGALNDNERSFIQSHPEVGYDIVKYIDFPWPIGQTVLQHHERMDGSGYPMGTFGDQICLEARILAVADVVESMSSHRPYRPALGLEKALHEIASNRGVLYDSNAVDCCVRLFKEKGYRLKSREVSEVM